MYRRKAGDAVPQAPTSGGAPDHKPRPATGSRSKADRGLSAPVVLTIGCIILFGSIILLSVVSPSSFQTAEDTVLQAGKMAEDEVTGLFGGGLHEKVVPPVAAGVQRRDRSIDATDAMLKHDSSWVDGEKKLKKKLKILAARQAQGKDLGVPVLTRWLGDDIPAWAGQGVDADDWKKKVDAKYAEMREDENKWREKVAQFMES